MFLELIKVSNNTLKLESFPTGFALSEVSTTHQTLDSTLIQEFEKVHLQIQIYLQ